MTSSTLFGTDTYALAPYQKHSPCPVNGEQDGVLYCGDEVPVVAALMDKCGGYADKEGRYKYHVPPVCLIDQLSAMATRSAEYRAAINSSTVEEGLSVTLKKRLQALQLGPAWTAPSPQLGWALDGFPIYGPVGTKGIPMLRCGSTGAHASVCLDDCNGYKGATAEDKFMYR